MPYNKTNWQNEPSTATPLSAANLNNLESQYEAVVADIGDTATELGQALSETFAARRVYLVGLIGQSNMSGRGADYSTFKDPIHPRIFQFGAKVQALRAASEPLDHRDTPTGIGPGLQFARQWIADLAGDDVIVLVPGAYGGTPLVSNDTLAWRYGVSGNLTAQWLAQYSAAKGAVAAQWPNAAIVDAGVLWFQGESDSAAGVAVTGAAYDADYRALISGVRSVIGRSDLPWIGMPFIPEAMDVGTRAQVRGVQSLVPYEIASTGFVAPIPEGYSNGDNLHANAPAHRLFYGPRAYEEYRRVIGGRAAVNPSLVVPDPPAIPTEGSTIWTDTFTGADVASRSVTDTAGKTWTTAVADGVNQSTQGIKGNAGAIYRATGTTSLFATVDSGAVSRYITWNFSVQGSANVRALFCYGGVGQYYAIRANGSIFDVRRYDDLTTYQTIASTTLTGHTTGNPLLVKALVHRPDPSGAAAYLYVWVAGSLLVNGVTLTSYINNTSDGVSYLTTSGSDSTRLDSITVNTPV